jgi:hypothetical protein
MRADDSARALVDLGAGARAVAAGGEAAGAVLAFR